MHITYSLQYIKVLCDDKEDSPVRYFLLDGVDLGTVRTLSVPSLSDCITTKMTQFDATIGAVCSKNSPIQLPKCIGKILRFSDRDELQVRSGCSISGCTVLDV